MAHVVKVSPDAARRKRVCILGILNTSLFQGACFSHYPFSQPQTGQPPGLQSHLSGTLHPATGTLKVTGSTKFPWEIASAAVVLSLFHPKRPIINLLRSPPRFSCTYFAPYSMLIDWYHWCQSDLVLIMWSLHMRLHLTEHHLRWKRLLRSSKASLALVPSISDVHRSFTPTRNPAKYKLTN